MEKRILFDAAAPVVIADIAQENDSGPSVDNLSPTQDESSGEGVSPQEVEEQAQRETDQLVDILYGNEESANPPAEVDYLIDSLAESDPEQTEQTPITPNNETTDSAEEAAGENESVLEQQEQQESPAPVVAELSSKKSENDATETLIVIDSGLEDHEILVEEAEKKARVLLIEEGDDGIAEISKALSQEATTSSLHIISHGSEGSISLGGTQIDDETVAKRSSELASWSQFMSEDGDILLYGCSVAEDSGEQFIQSLAAVTQADVAASVDATGAAQQDGNWILEAQTGNIESILPMSGEQLSSYDHLLASPTIDGISETLMVDEDTDLAITTMSVGDSDGDNLQVTLTAADGTISLSSLTNWSNLSVDSGADGSATITVSGAVADINSALSGMTYRAPQDFNGNTSIQIVVTDDPDNDGIFAGDGDDTEVTSNATLNIEVIQTNDAPELAPTALQVQEHQGDVAFGDANFGLTDVDIDTGQQVLSQQIVEIKSLPMEGTLKFNGSSIVVGSSFSYTNIHLLTYSHGGADVSLSSNNTDSFTVNITDGAGGETGITTIDIDLTPKNAAPTITGSPTVFEGQTTGLGLTWTDEESAHADAAANTTVTISNVNNQGEGTLFFDANDNNIVDAGEELTSDTGTNPAISADQLDLIKFQHDGNEPLNTPTFDITVTDAGGGEGAGSALSATETITISLREVDDDPTLAANRDGLNNLPNEDGDDDDTDYGTVSGDFFDVAGASAKIITNTDLQVVDVDSGVQNLVYTITSAATYGNLELEISPGIWANLDAGDRFTQDQIDNNKIRFNYTTEAPAENSIDSFTFTVRDSELKAWQEPGPVPVADNTGQEGGIYNGNTSDLKEFTFNMLLDPWTGSGGGTPGTDIDLDLNGTISNVGIEVYEGQSNTIGDTLIDYRSYSGDSGTPDYEVPADEILFRITSLATNGSIEKLDGGNWVTVDLYDHFTQADINNDAVRFVQNGSEDFQSSFTFSITDGANEEIQTFKTETTPINDAPVGTGGLLEAKEAVIGDDSSGIVRITDAHIGMSDGDEAEEVLKRSEAQGDQDSLWFAISDLPDDGSLEYYNGSAWTEITSADLYGGDPADVLWFSKSILIMSVDGGTSGVRYAHHGLDDPDSLADDFKFYVRDDLGAPAGSGIADAVISGQATVSDNLLNTPATQPEVTPPTSYIDGNNLSNEATVAISIAAFNDPPQVPADYSTPDESIPGTIPGGGGTTEANELLEMAEGATETITSAHLSTIDPDNTTVQRQYKITDIVDYGMLKLNGSALSVGSTFTQDDIDSSRITYTHNGSENFQDFFSFIVDDGLATDSGRFDIIINEPLNDAPAITAPADQYYDTAAPFEFGGTGKRIVISDPDLVSVSAGETDFVQAIINADNVNAIFALSSVPGGLKVLAGNGGVRGESLIIQGSLADVQTALDNMELTFKDGGSADIDLDTDVQITVSIDDRLRDSSGVLIAGANGGAANEGGLPINETNNIATKSFLLFSSNVNDPPTLQTSPTGPIEAVEDTWGNIDTYEFADPDAFSTTTNSVTIEIRKQDDSAAGTGAVRITSDGGASVSGNSSGSLTVTGTLSQINAALTSLQYRGAADFNGSELIRVTYSDNGNVGVGAAVPVVDTVQVNVKPVNDTPDVTFNGGNAPSTQYVTADDDFVFNAASSNLIAISDAKDVGQASSPIDEYTVTITSTSGGAGYGTLTLADTTGLAVAGDGSSTITITAGSMAGINSALDGLKFNSGELDANKAATITIDLDDLNNGGTRIGGNSGSQTDQLVIDLIISSDNDNPTDNSANTDAVAALEDAWTTINGTNSFVFDDADTFSSNTNTVVVSATEGTLRVSALAGSATINNGGVNVGVGSGSTSITITGTLADINATLQNLQYKGSLDLNGSDQDTISATFTDTGNPGGDGSDKLSVTSDRTVDIAAVNDAPTTLISEVALPAQTEDDLAPPAQTLSDLLDHATDPGHQAFSDTRDNVSGGSSSDDFTSVVIVNNSADSGSEGAWQYFSGGSWQDIPTDLTESSGMVLTLATQIRFVPTSNFNGEPGDLTVRLVENDDNGDAPGGGGSTAAGARINVSGLNSGGTSAYSDSSNEVLIKTSVTPVNDTPTAPIATGSATVEEDTWGSFTGPAVLPFADVDTGSSSDNTVVVSVDKGDMKVTLSGSAAITAGSNESGSLTLTGSLADINATLSTLQYKGEQDENGLNKATLTATYDDQGNSGGGSASTEVTLTRSITITAVNDAPATLINEVTLPSASEATPSADNQTVSNLFATAFDDSRDGVTGGSSADNFTSIVIVGNAADSGTEGVWEYRDGGAWIAVSESLSPSSGLVLSKDAELRFNPTDDFTGIPGELTVRLGEDDNLVADVPPSGTGGGADTTSGNTVDVSGANSGTTTPYSDSSNEVRIGINITPVNDPPVNIVPGPQTVNEDNSITFSSGGGNGLSITDPDVNETASPGNTLRTTVSVSNGILDVNDGLGAAVTDDSTSTVTIVGTIDQINQALEGMTYTPDLNFNGNDTLTITTNDLGNTGAGGAMSDTDSVNITVNAVNDDPPTADPFYGETTNTQSITVVLSGGDVDGDLQEMEIKSLPDSTRGTLYHPDGTTPVAIGDILTPADAAKLLFTPKPGVTGLVTFDYFTRDAASNVSTDAEAKILITAVPVVPPATISPAPEPDPSPPEPNPIVLPVQGAPAPPPAPPSQTPVLVPASESPEVAPPPPIVSVSANQAITFQEPHNQEEPASRHAGYSNTMQNWSMASSFGEDLQVWFFLELADKSCEVEETYEYIIPAAAIHHTEPNATINFFASKSDGTPLPPWIIFDEDNRAFQITPPSGAPEEMVLKVKAIDEWGNETEALFTIRIVDEGVQQSGKQPEKNQTDETTDNQNPEEKPQQEVINQSSQLKETAGEVQDSFMGKPGFTEQLALAGRQKLLDDSATLLSALIN